MVMKNSISYICATLFLFNLSCSKSNAEQDPTNSVGYLATGFNNNIDSSYVETKADAPVDMFWIRVKNSETGSYIYQSTRDRIADILELKIGNYSVEADYPEVKENAAFDQPHFWGEVDNVVIEKDKITRLEEITTTIQNMKVDVTFGEHIKSHFSEYSVTVSNDKGELIFNQFTSQSGYYTLSPLKVKFEGRRSENGSLVEKDFGTVVTTLGKAYHHNIIIDSQFTYSTKGSVEVEKTENNEFSHTLFVD